MKSLHTCFHLGASNLSDRRPTILRCHDWLWRFFFLVPHFSSLGLAHVRSISWYCRDYRREGH